MHVFDQKPNFMQIVVKLIITYILRVKYCWPISLKQEILYIIIKSYLAQIYKNTSNQIYIQLGSKCFEFFVSLKIYLLNQSEINRNMICYPSFNQSYSQLDDFFFKRLLRFRILYAWQSTQAWMQPELKQRRGQVQTIPTDRTHSIR